MKKIFGVILFLIIIFLTIGRENVFEIAGNFIVKLGEVLAFLAECIVKVLPMMGIEDVIISALVFGGVFMLISGVGLVLSAKKKRILWIVISTIVEIVSTIVTMGSALALK